MAVKGVKLVVNKGKDRKTGKGKGAELGGGRAEPIKVSSKKAWAAPKPIVAESRLRSLIPFLNLIRVAVDDRVSVGVGDFAKIGELAVFLVDKVKNISSVIGGDTGFKGRRNGNAGHSKARAFGNVSSGGLKAAGGLDINLLVKEKVKSIVFVNGFALVKGQDGMEVRDTVFM